MDDVSAHYARVEQRWKTLEWRMEKKVAAYSDIDRSSEARMLGQAASAPTMAKKIFWLRSAAAAFTKRVEKDAACRRGCSHCCNISVVISKQEAQVIAREIGVKINPRAGVDMKSSPDFNDENPGKMYGVPCVFLRDGECSIYESRPLACRLHINMDDDDLLCRLVESVEKSPRVPYLNNTEHLIASVKIFGEQTVFDDIRNWFA